MTISAGLHLNPGIRGSGQVVSHQPRGATQKGEGTAQHAPIADGNQFGQTIPIGLFQNSNGVAALRRQFPLPMALAWKAIA